LARTIVNSNYIFCQLCVIYQEKVANERGFMRLFMGPIIIMQK